MSGGGKKRDASDECAAILLRYLQEQNRPHSAQDVFSNLQKQHGLGKTAVVKALEQLAQQGKINEKIYGKQKIYFPDQNRFGNTSESELKGLDNEISELSCKVQTLQQNCRHMESELKELKGSMTTPEMVKEIEDLKKDCANYTEKLERIKSAANHVSPEEKEKVYSDKKLYCREWRRRKRMEEVGIETDEDFNVTVPSV
ncbi:Homologous-pairing protein 2-like protein [Ophiophagus hannah]|uniref:Homologous-pairing protein 2 homolog n=1 Tax=Ophiophagus hannah TaxID=8665 RepID=V8NU44_OPHHA|nr:Homologous-pairing protein 2-like protein [Ophiophagus hannah]